MGLRVFAVSVLSLSAITGLVACPSLPPAVTGVTIFPSAADGTPHGLAMWRTRRQPPIPVLGMRPGTDPSDGALFLNEPVSGAVAVTLAQGVQNFLLYGVAGDESDHFVIAIFLDHEPTPALTSVVDSDPTHPVVPSRAATVQGLDGDEVANHSQTAVVSRGYRVELTRATFPLPVHVDAVTRWLLRYDNAADAVGVITLEVRRADASR